MDLKTPLKLKYFYHTPETRQKAREEEPYKINECIEKTVVLYSLDCLAPFVDYDDEDRVYGMVYAGGENFITTITPKELYEIVEKHRL